MPNKSKFTAAIEGLVSASRYYGNLSQNELRAVTAMYIRDHVSPERRRDLNGEEMAEDALSDLSGLYCPEAKHDWRFMMMIMAEKWIDSLVRELADDIKDHFEEAKITVSEQNAAGRFD
jgi:hypothetical protein